MRTCSTTVFTVCADMYIHDHYYTVGMGEAPWAAIRPICSRHMPRLWRRSKTQDISADISLEEIPVPHKGSVLDWGRKEMGRWLAGWTGEMELEGGRLMKHPVILIMCVCICQGGIKEEGQALPLPLEPCPRMVLPATQSLTPQQLHGT